MTDMTDDDLALLRAGCEYAGQEQSFPRTGWTVELPSGACETGVDAEILAEPYASNLLGALMARLRADRHAWSIEDEGGFFYVEVLAAHHALWRKARRQHDSPLLALLRAMRDAGIIQTEAGSHDPRA